MKLGLGLRLTKGVPTIIDDGSASASLSGAATLSAIASYSVPASSSMSGNASISANATLGATGSASLSGSASLVANSSVIIPASVSLSGSASLSASATVSGGSSADVTSITSLSGLTNYTDFTDDTGWSFSGDQVIAIPRDAGTTNFTLSSNEWNYTSSLFGGAGGLEQATAGAQYSLAVSAGSTVSFGVVMELPTFASAADLIHGESSIVRVVHGASGRLDWWWKQSNAVQTMATMSGDGVSVLLMNFTSDSNVDWYITGPDGTDYSGSFDPNDAFNSRTEFAIGSRSSTSGVSGLKFKEIFHCSDALTSGEVTDILSYLKSSAGL